MPLAACQISKTAQQNGARLANPGPAYWHLRIFLAGADAMLGTWEARDTFWREKLRRIVEGEDGEDEAEEAEEMEDAPPARKKRVNRLDTSQKLLLTVQEAADLLGVSRAKLYPKVMRGEILSLKDGNQRLIPRAALEQFIRERIGDEETSEINRNHHLPAKKRVP